MRFVFLGSPPFAVPVLEALLESGHEALALVTRPDKPRGRGREVHTSPLVELAHARGLRVLQPTTTKDPAFVAELRALAPDVLVVASYGELLRTELLELAPHGALNVHGSLLPRWRGAAPIQKAVMEGDAETGVSIQRMVLALDEGDVLLERRTPIGAHETSGQLFERLALLGGEAAVAALDLLASGDARFTPQDPARVTYAKKLTKEDGSLDWSRDAAGLERLVRAVTPWPGARTLAPGGKELVVLEARCAEGAGAPGTLLETKPRCLVACGTGALELVTVKPAGKQAMEATAWLNGARLAAGERLGES
ncbi:MAG: methionyl-tRNA formyltransferase [Planctomycetes bacterium]|nr:methionyl-tRNA formyltransferase [Planctomycetota bacterium]